MVLSFAAYRQSLDASLPVGTVVAADLHRYPGAGARAIVGERYGDRRPLGRTRRSRRPPCPTALAEVGGAMAREPWSERVPVILRAAPTPAGRLGVERPHGFAPDRHRAHRRRRGGAARRVGGHPVAVSAEWTASGLVPLAVLLADRVLDIGPLAERRS